MPIFPERFPRPKLEKIRRRIGNDELFFCQYMCDPRGGESSQFRREWIKYYETNELPSLLNLFLTCDPGGLRPDTGDFTAYLVCGVDKRNNIYILHSTAIRHNPREIIDTLFDLKQQFPSVMTIGIEGVAYQKSLMFFAQEEMRRRNVFLPIRELETSTRVSKEMRIRSLVPRFSNGTVFLKAGQTEIVDQLLDFPKGRHDDLIDALAYQLQLLIVPQEAAQNVVDPMSMEFILTELAQSFRLKSMGKLLETRLSNQQYEQPTLN
jgi:predicted phage terminase large subunit-like protein